MNAQHKKLCQCAECAGRRFNEFQARIEAFRKKYKVAPANPEATVPVKTYQVRAHFRRNPRHMTNDPALREKATQWFKGVKR